MLKTDSYEPKLKIIDKSNIQHVIPSGNLIYSGNLNLLRNERKETNNGPRPLAVAVLGLDNTAAPLPNNLDFYHTWTDIDSQEAYLNLKPTCYIILSKPGTGAYLLGESMAKKLNIVHISPKNVLADEIEQRSITGQCIDFNLRHNNVCKYDTIIAIMKKKIESSAVQHRGCVISGLPLVTSSENMQYLNRNLHDEESVSVADEIVISLFEGVVKKKRKGRKFESDTLNSSKSSDYMLEIESEIEEEEQEPEVEEETQQIVALPKFILEPSFNIILFKKSYLSSKEAVLLDQSFKLFDLNANPSIIIFITCPDTDAITKKSRKYFNYLTSSNPTYYSPFLLSSESEIRWPSKYALLPNVLSPSDSSSLNRKYHCRLPINFVYNSENQMCNYKHHVTPYLENKIKDFESRFVLKLDGRNTIYEMVNILFDKLLLLPVKPVLIPEPLYLEEPSEDLEDFWRLAEEMNVIKFGVKRFGRYASPWCNRCPVELKKRHVVQGFPKFAVAFFNRIYLLSSLNAMVSFCRNPRPFLKLEYLEPTCRIIVMGTKSSGKSMISQCLSWLFNTSVICYETLFNDVKQRKYNNFIQLILPIIVEKVEAVRITAWEKTEENRISNLNVWYTSKLKALQRYVHLLKEYQTQSSTDEMDDESSSTAKSIEVFKKLQNLFDELYFIPNLYDLEMCQEILNKQSLLQYAPLELTKEIPKPASPVLGDQDVMKELSIYILENNSQNDIEPTFSEIMHEITTELANIDLHARSELNGGKEYGTYVIDGFPLDAECWDFLFGTEFFPDYIITIIEDREIDEEIAQNYINVEICSKRHESRFRLANDGLIKTKLCSESISERNLVTVDIFVKELINGIIQSLFINKSELINYLNESINKFREEWDALKVNITETCKSCIEVQIENKTDIQIVEEVLVNIRKSYSVLGNSELDEIEDRGSEDGTSADSLVHNDPRSLCETNVYCPIAYYKYGVLWEGRSEFGLKYDNKLHYFSKEEFSSLFQNDVTKYQSYNKPFKKIPPMKICVMGTIGSGRTSASTLIAKEYGLIHIDFVEFINGYLLPRHYKKVGRQFENSFTDVPIDEENLMELNINEDNLNLEMDVLSNENELRRMVYSYLEKGAPLLSVLMQKILKQLWFQPPFSTTGFVLDGFPKMQTDVDDMIECFCIPDLVIELECNSEISSERLTPKMFATWKTQLHEAKIKSRIKLDSEKLQWRNYITKQVVVNLILEEILDNAARITIESHELETAISAQSTIMEPDPTGLLNVDANLFKFYNNLILEYPEPIDQSEWEKPNDVREKIIERIESTFEIEDENIQTLKESLEEQNVKSISINGTKSFMKVGRIILSKVASLRHKREGYFEQTFVIDLDVAEMLLLEGFYFLSKFYRMCPVYIFDNPHTIFNPYFIGKAKNKVTPVIHRSHIYFTCNEINLKKFRENPLKYIVNDNIKYFIEYPMRIAIIGPPKSGKSELTAKLAKKYGLLCVSKGMALRHIINNLSWTDLSLKISSKLEKGEVISSYTVIQAVQTVVNNYCSLSRGFVLDGLPSSPFEALELQKIGIFPLTVFELCTDRDTVIKNSQKEIYHNILKRKPPYSRNLITYRLSKYNEKCDRITHFINNDTQNLFILNGAQSRWKCLYETDNNIRKIIPQIHYYLTNYKTKIVSLAAMCISDYDFQLKMSRYKNICPICLRENIINHGGYPVDKTGVVQFKKHFYWICREHLNSVLKDPTKLLNQSLDIPDIPAVVKTINPYNLYEDGICIVTYAENLPAQRIESGKEDYAAVYKEKTYLFCSPICLKKFLATPQKFYDISVFKECKIFPPMFLKNLPHLGYLEQTVGNIITEACCSVNVVRPKYPGLTAQISGLLYIALYLKIHNPLTNVSYLPLYTKAINIFESRCQLLTSVGMRLRALDNPFGNYPQCCSNIQDVTKQIDSGTVMKPSSSFKIVSNISSSFSRDFNIL